MQYNENYFNRALLTTISNEGEQSMTQYEFHEYASVFPILEGTELEALLADIKENGQINKIILYKGKILDGRNRYTVCKILGIEPETIEYTGDDPLGLVISQNINRRHLDTSQRAMVAAKLANLLEGRPKNSANLPSFNSNSSKGLQKQTDFQSANLPTKNPNPTPWKLSDEEIEQRKEGRSEPVSQSEAAEKLNVSTRSVTNAAKVIKNAVPEVVAAVESGRLAISAAATLAEKKPEQQRKILAKCEKDGSGQLGKDGKIRPQKYQPRKKTVAKVPACEEEDYGDRYEEWQKDLQNWRTWEPGHSPKTPSPTQNLLDKGILKFPLPVDHQTAYQAFVDVFRSQSDEVKNRVIEEIHTLAEIIHNLND